MSALPNKVVTINYTLKDEEGNVIDQTSQNKPFQYLSGTSQILPKLEEQIDGMLIGGKKNVVIPPKEGYGEYQDDALQSIERNAFPKETELEVGMSFVANSPDGKQLPFVIKEVDDESVKVDFNHPLAGKTLNFEVELLDKREATPEEVSHGHAHGPDGHHH
jgi:FKBP-type peptidyl-prolyl cis-trans isomerase SlyD